MKPLYFAFCSKTAGSEYGIFKVQFKNLNNLVPFFTCYQHKFRIKTDYNFAINIHKAFSRQSQSIITI